MHTVTAPSWRAGITDARLHFNQDFSGLALVCWRDGGIPIEQKIPGEFLAALLDSPYNARRGAASPSLHSPVLRPTPAGSSSRAESRALRQAIRRMARTIGLSYARQVTAESRNVVAAARLEKMRTQLAAVEVRHESDLAAKVVEITVLQTGVADLRESLLPLEKALTDGAAEREGLRARVAELERALALSQSYRGQVPGSLINHVAASALDKAAPPPTPSALERMVAAAFPSPGGIVVKTEAPVHVEGMIPAAGGGA